MVEATRRHLPVIVVDDGSSDGTAEVARAAGATVIEQRPNQGKGAGLRAGFRQALDDGAEAILTLDADGQHDPGEIPSFVASAWTIPPADQEPRPDLVIGRRSFHRGMPRIRRLSNELGRRAFSWAVGRDIPDNQSGYRLGQSPARRARARERRARVRLRGGADHDLHPAGRHDRLGPDPDDLRRCAVPHPPDRPPPRIRPDRPPGAPRRPDAPRLTPWTHSSSSSGPTRSSSARRRSCCWRGSSRPVIKLVAGRTTRWGAGQVTRAVRSRDPVASVAPGANAWSCGRCQVGQPARCGRLLLVSRQPGRGRASPGPDLTMTAAAHRRVSLTALRWRRRGSRRPGRRRGLRSRRPRTRGRG